MKRTRVISTFLMPSGGNDSEAVYIPTERVVVEWCRAAITGNVTGGSPTDATIYAVVCLGNTETSINLGQFSDLTLALWWKVIQRKVDAQNISFEVNESVPVGVPVDAGSPIYMKIQDSTGVSLAGIIMIGLRPV